MNARILVAGVLVLAACAPKRVNEAPILQNGDRVPDSEMLVESARTQSLKQTGQFTGARDSIAASALATCAPSVCGAIARGEVALGMTESQVLAATRTTDGAWTVRDAGNASVMVPAVIAPAPRDAIGELAMVQLREGRVAAYSYREAQGVRVVTTAREATTAGRASSLADMLVREGDDLVARGALDEALNRYDRAQVLRPNDPQVDYRIATLLDKQLRPVEALIRYRLFLHKLELEKIQATGSAYAELASAIAHARERIIILEKQKR